MQNERYAHGGFSLLETLISLVILSGVVSVGMIQFVSSQRALRRMETTNQLTVDAEELLGRVGIDIPLRAGRWSGQTQTGAAWNVLIEPYRSEGSIIKSLWKVRVQLRAIDVPPVEFATLKRGVR